MMGIDQLNHLWQSTCFAMAAGLLAFTLRKNSASVRYWLWLCASLKFLIPFALFMSIGSQLHFAPSTQQLASRIAATEVTFTVEQISQPFFYNGPAAPAAPSHASLIPAITMFTIWLIGFGAVLATRFRDWLRIRNVVVASERMEIPVDVEVRAAAGLLEPGVVGVFRPVLLLPEGIHEQLTNSQLEAVLAHELCHVRRRDNLFASLHMIVEALFWFHPLVWWIGARLVEERERACDEEVLRLGNQPRVYADAIVSICRHYAESPLACVAGVTGSDIKRRIEAIMANRRGVALNFAKKIMLAGAGVAALAGPIVIGALMGVVHLPSVHAQSPVTAEPQLLVDRDLIAQVGPRGAVSHSGSSSVAAAPTSDKRLVAMLFDFSSMSLSEQAAARQAGISLVQNQLKPADSVSVMLAGNGPVQVVQDFTSDANRVNGAIQQLGAPAGSPSPDSPSIRAGNIKAAAGILGALPEKKQFFYFANGVAFPDSADGPQTASLVESLRQANVAIFPIDVRNGETRPDAARFGLVQDIYDARLREAQAKFGSSTSAMARSYIRYGEPNQIEDRGSSQVWHYSYLDDFQDRAAFEFIPASNRASILYPPAGVSFQGQFRSDNEIALLTKNVAPTFSGTVADLPSGHATLQVYKAIPGVGPSADRRYPTVSIPLDSFSGQIVMSGQLRARTSSGESGRVVASIQDRVQASSTPYQASFTVAPGSYVFDFVVVEQLTGRVFGETINFDAE
jgi:beta-lactamase regulating signal transducer with metallopeptidase domain